jgi:TRAP-type transport system periplasmic protein
MNYRFRIRALGALLGALALMGGATGAQAQTTTLTLSSWVPPTHQIVTDILQPWMEAVKQETQGRVVINMLPKAVGAPAQHFELARRGVADITFGNFSYEPERFKHIWFSELPLMGDQSEAKSVALWRTYDRFLSNNEVFKGVSLLGVGLLGGGHIHHPSKSIASMESIKGLKVRMGGPIQKQLLEAMGAIPVAGPATRAYEMLEGGVIDASLNPMESMISLKLDGKLRHHTIVPQGLYDAAFFIAMNESKLRRLSVADRQALMKVSGEALSRRWGVEFDKQNANAMKKLKADGHVFVEPGKDLMDVTRKVRAEILQALGAEGKKFGVADYAAMVSFYEQQYQTLKK